MASFGNFFSSFVGGNKSENVQESSTKSASFKAFEGSGRTLAEQKVEASSSKTDNNTKTSSSGFFSFFKKSTTNENYSSLTDEGDSSSQPSSIPASSASKATNDSNTSSNSNNNSIPVKQETEAERRQRILQATMNRMSSKSSKNV